MMNEKIIEPNKNLDDIEFTIFDTETTGLEPQSGDRIIEIAAVRFKNKEKISDFQTLVNPNRPISQEAFQVNGISQDMLKDAPQIEAILPKFLDFIQGSLVCSYNAPFDLEFLLNELKIAGKPLSQDIVFIDILKMARRMLPGLARYALISVAEKLGIKTKQEHRAASDVELAWQVFDKLKEQLLLKGIFDVNNFSSLFSINKKVLDNVNNQKIAEIQEAISLGIKLKIKYLSSYNAEVSEREVIPKEIRQEKNNSYLVGFCCLRNEERTFRIDGILRLEIV